ncbi:MAG: glycosyltransferase [Bacteroidaceae bacterium]|nr:glycosyltransferase [Bacteroidaceae bacterium]
MPTLLQLNCTSNWGSTGKIAEQIGMKAQDAGWKCYVAFCRNANPSSLNNIKVGNMFWTLEHYAENLFLDNEGLASRLSTKRLLKEIDKIKPDVVHLHNIHDHWLNYKMLFEYLIEKQIPVVWSQHDQWATTGHCYYSNIVGCELWKTECCHCPLSKWYSLDRSRRNFNLKKNLCAGLKSLTIVPVSEWLADNIRQSHLKNYTIEVIHNGIDINVFKPQITDVKARLGIGSKKIVLSVATSWSERKGLLDYIALSKILSHEYVIVLIGLNKGLIESLPHNMVGIGLTQNNAELATYYSMADIVMSLSYSETFGLTIVEGMACGSPAIVYNNTAQKYLIDENTGLAVETGDIASVAEAIKMMDTKLIANKEKISTACRKRAEEYFDKDKCFEKYVELYERLIR